MAAGTAGTAKKIDGEPGGLTTLLRAALPAVPGVNRLPGVRKAPASDFAGLAFRRDRAIFHARKGPG